MQNSSVLSVSRARASYAALFSVSAAAALGKTLVYARVLQPAEFGAVGLTVLVATFAAYLGSVGITDGLGSAVPLARGRGEDSTALRSAGLSGVIQLSLIAGLLTTVVCSLVMPVRAEYMVLLLAGPLLSLTAILNALFVDLQARELNVPYAFLLLLKSALPLLLAVPMGRTSGALGVVGAELIGAALCIALFGWRWRGGLIWSRDRAAAVGLARLGAPYVTGNVLQNVSMNADRWAVQSAHGVQGLGTYGFAMHLSSIGMVLLNMVQLYASPRLLRRFGTDGDKVALRRHSIRIALILAGAYAAAAVPLVLAFPWLLERFFPAYIGAAPLALWVALGTGAIALGYFDVLFRAAGNGRPVAAIQAVAVIVGVVVAGLAAALDAPLWVFALGFCLARVTTTCLGWTAGLWILRRAGTALGR